MEKLVLALTGAVTIVGAVLFLFGVHPDETKPIDLPPVPPLSSTPVAPLVCRNCPDPASPTILEQDGVSVQVTAEPVLPSDAKPDAPATAKVTVKIRTQKPAKVAPSQNYIVLRPENGPDYNLPPSAYQFATASGETTRVSSPLAAGGPLDVPAGEDWPAAADTVESELDFLVNVDILSGRFSVKLPDILVDGKGYALPPLTFEQKAP